MALAICDSHVHVFHPARFPYVTPRRFTPGEATVAHLQAHMRAVGLARVVLVQPSVYGEQNDCLLDALTALGERSRGVAVVSRQTSAQEIDRLNAAGVCGARINLVVDHLQAPAAALRKMQEVEGRIPPQWHVQLHVAPNVVGELTDYIERSSRPYVLDHMGLPNVALGRRVDTWTKMLRLVQGGKLYVKLSAPYLYSRIGPPYNDLAPFVESLLHTRSDRLLWGSNWPHTQGTGRSFSALTETLEAFRQVDDSAWLETCRLWSTVDTQAVLGDNAARLYGFPESVAIFGTDEQKTSA